MKNTSFTITAKLNVSEQGAEGVIITQGGRFAGWGLLVLDGKPVWAYKNTNSRMTASASVGPRSSIPAITRSLSTSPTTERRANTAKAASMS